MIHPDPKPGPHQRRYKTREAKRENAMAYCARNGCYKVPEHIGRCTPHAKDFLDDRVRERVPMDRCELEPWHRGLFQCGGRIVVNHGIERGYLLTRWLLENCMGGCSGMNSWAFNHRREWDQMLIDNWGFAKFERLRVLSISRAVPDYEATLETLLRTPPLQIRRMR